MENFSFSSAGTSSDNRYILRKMLVRGASEAYYRYRLYEGDVAFDFKRLAFQFEDLIDDLDSILDEESIIRDHDRDAIIRTIQICQYLFALDHAETVADYRNLMAYLTRDPRPDCSKSMVGA